MPDITPTIDQGRMLSQRLERLSVDSQWARRVSGLRGGLIKLLDELERTPPGEVNAQDVAQLEQIMRRGFWMLENAARQIPG